MAWDSPSPSIAATVSLDRRSAFHDELAKRLAVDFGVSYRTITKIIHGRAWSHVGGPIKIPGQIGRYGRKFL